MKGLLLADIFFRDYNEDGLWGWNHWLKKTVFHAQCWPQGKTFKACKAQMDLPALHVPSDSEHLRQSMYALSYFSQTVTVFMSGKDQALLDLSFLGLSQNMDIIWWQSLKKIWKSWRGTLNGRRTIKSKDITLNYIDTSTFNGKVICYLEPKINHLSSLYTIPSLSIVYYLLYCYCNGIEWHWWPKSLLSLNVALTEIESVFMAAIPWQCAYTL